mmetsp:Transcript_112084/g.322169  ORF Transcript_112084/g.322169 Transcript_112084/m.322169 type:complete len:330 (-) Transcript_112084:382-1371(-)
MIRWKDLRSCSCVSSSASDTFNAFSSRPNALINKARHSKGDSSCKRNARCSKAWAMRLKLPQKLLAAARGVGPRPRAKAAPGCCAARTTYSSSTRWLPPRRPPSESSPLAPPANAAGSTAAAAAVGPGSGSLFRRDSTFNSSPSCRPGMVDFGDTSQFKWKLLAPRGLADAGDRQVKGDGTGDEDAAELGLFVPGSCTSGGTHHSHWSGSSSSSLGVPSGTQKSEMTATVRAGAAAAAEAGGVAFSPLRRTYAWRMNSWLDSRSFGSRLRRARKKACPSLDTSTPSKNKRSSFSMLASSCIGLAPENGVRPNRSSYKIAPTDQRSARAS